MRLAARLKKRGVKVLYYVAPQAWAWKAGRSAALSQNTHTLFTILPFEKDWFGSRGVKQIKSIPHPLMLTYKDQLNSIPEKPFGSWDKKLKLLLLPGSRRFEVHSLLPAFIQSVKLLKKEMPVEVHLVKVNHLKQDIYDYYKNDIDVWYESDELTKAMNFCHISLASSGTVTLSTGLFELPTIVCYKASLLNEFIFYNLIKYSGPISLTNIVHNQMVFPELTQSGVDPAKIASIIRTWTSNENLYNGIKSTLKDTKKLLSGEDLSIPHYMARVIHE
jgi:lipid-A-disaccharide synthase